MPRPCTACAHPERAAIESDLLADALSFRTVAGRYGLSSSAVDRHRAKHMAAYTVGDLLAPGEDGFWTRWTGSKLQRIPTPRLADLIEIKGIGCAADGDRQLTLPRARNAHGGGGGISANLIGGGVAPLRDLIVRLLKIGAAIVEVTG